jgi:SAM-dependent methyltransferase
LNDRAVSLLYDALLELEGPYRDAIAYPVHKRLSFRETEARDIYDWVCAHVELPQRGNILDAGCGVGFGTFRLASLSTCCVVGLSLSEHEVRRARSAALLSNLADRVTFHCDSFDDVPRGAYDLVIAVESLKHSADLDRSLDALCGSLREKGQLVIVEDLYAGGGSRAVADRLAADWGLRMLYTEPDFVARLGAAQCRVVDLTACVPRASQTALLVRRAMLALALVFVRGRRGMALRAFRGGLNLQRLYADRAMTYKAIFWRRPAAV